MAAKNGNLKQMEDIQYIGDINPTHDFEKLKNHRLGIWGKKKANLIEERGNFGQDTNEAVIAMGYKIWLADELKIIERWLAHDTGILDYDKKSIRTKKINSFKRGWFNNDIEITRYKEFIEGELQGTNRQDDDSVGVPVNLRFRDLLKPEYVSFADKIIADQKATIKEMKKGGPQKCIYLISALIQSGFCSMTLKEFGYANTILASMITEDFIRVSVEGVRQNKAIITDPNNLNYKYEISKYSKYLKETITS